MASNLIAHPTLNLSVPISNNGFPKSPLVKATQVQPHSRRFGIHVAMSGLQTPQLREYQLTKPKLWKGETAGFRT